MKTGHFALAILLAAGMGATTTIAQDGPATAAPADSLAAAARQARQEQKDQPKAAKVYTNDNLPTNATISYVGAGQSTPATKDAANSGPAGGADQNANAAAKGGGSADKSSDEAALEKAKQQLESAKKDLDIDQRKYALDQQDYLTNPNHASDTEGAQTLQTEQDGISAKKDEVDAAQKVVDDLKARLDAESDATSSAPAGGNSSAPNSDNSASSSAAGSHPSDSNSTSAPAANPTPTSPASDDSDAPRL